jgi:small subunit ribosomal protein S17
VPKRILQGVVVSDKADKTVVVLIERRFTHPLLKKTVRRTKKYHAHDDANVARTGDIVRIQECRPISKTKAWTLLDKVRPELESGGVSRALPAWRAADEFE